MCAKIHPEPDGRSCTAPRTSPYRRVRHVRFCRCVVAHLGRFLPRLGPFVFPSGPFFIPWLRAISRIPTVAFHSYVPPNFCDAKRFACILCAAHLDRSCGVGDPVAGFAALLGRFLPRLGPHGSPRGPFYTAMLARDEALTGLGLVRRVTRGVATRRPASCLLLRRNMGDLALLPHALIRRRRGARARGAALRTL